MSSTRASLDKAPLLPAFHAGLAYDARVAARGWVAAAWLLAVELRAYLEDLDGGVRQSDLRRVVALRIVELLVEVDAQLTGARQPHAPHALALALEHGLQFVADVPGRDLLEILQLDIPLDRAQDDCGVHSVRKFAERLLAEFPGELPNPLQAGGQGEMLRALRAWSKLADAAGVDASFLEPLLKAV